MEIAAFPPQAALVRAWLELQDGPRTCPQIAAAIGRPGDTLVYQNVHRMWRDGILGRTGRCRQYAFTLLRDIVMPKRMPSEEQKCRNAAAERKRRRLAGSKPLDEYRAECRARSTARIALVEAAKAKRRADREAEREKRLAERKAATVARRRVPRVKPAPKPAAPRVRALALVPQSPPPVARESVDDYLRRGGKVIRLEPGACSHPLREFQEAA